jgi:superfamily II DNA or RNA helicase
MNEEQIKEYIAPGDNTLVDHASLSRFLQRAIGTVRSVLPRGKMEIISQGNTYVIKNVKGTDIQQLIGKRLGNRIANNLFINVTYYRITIDKFFIFELYHAILLANKTNTRRASHIDTQMVDTLLDLIEKDTWMHRLTQSYTPPPILDRSRIQKHLTWVPRDVQVEAMDYYDNSVARMNTRGTVTAIYTGGGKTATAIFLAEAMAGDILVILCPKVAIDLVWVDTLKDIYKKPRKIYTPFNGETRKNKDTFVVNYERIHEVQDILKRAGRRRVFVILDESHNMNTKGTIRSEKYLEMMRTSDNLYGTLLSGTYIKEAPAEALNILIALDPKFTPAVQKRWRKIFHKKLDAATQLLSLRLENVAMVAAKETSDLLDPISAVHEVKSPRGQRYELQVIEKKVLEYIKIRTDYYKRRAATTEEDIKKLLDTWKTIAGFSSTEYSRYKASIFTIHRSSSYGDLGETMKYTKDIEKQYILPQYKADEKKRIRSLLAEFKYYPLVVVGEALGRIIGRMRIEAAMEVATNFDYTQVIGTAKKKTVIFTNNIETGELIHEKLKAQGLKPLRLFGKHKDINLTVRAFGEADSLNPLIASYSLMSTAVPLIMADTAIFNDMPLRPHILEQAQARIWRSGAGQTYFHYPTLTTEEMNILDRSLDIMSWARKKIQVITGMDIASVPDQK